MKFYIDMKLFYCKYILRGTLLLGMLFFAYTTHTISGYVVTGFVTVWLIADWAYFPVCLRRAKAYCLTIDSRGLSLRIGSDLRYDKQEVNAFFKFGIFGIGRKIIFVTKSGIKITIDKSYDVSRALKYLVDYGYKVHGLTPNGDSFNSN